MNKKKSIYFLIPIVLLILFGAYDCSYMAGFQAKEDARKAAIQAAHDKKVEEDNQLRLKAVQDAIAAEDKRKAENAAKAAEAAKEAAEVEKAKDAQEDSAIDAQKLEQKYNNLEKSVRDAQEEIKKIDDDKKVQVGNLDFLQIETTEAKTNLKNLTDVLNQINAADAAFAAAEAARAATAKK